MSAPGDPKERTSAERSPAMRLRLRVHPEVPPVVVVDRVARAVRKTLDVLVDQWVPELVVEVDERRVALQDEPLRVEVGGLARLDLQRRRRLVERSVDLGHRKLRVVSVVP